MDDLDESVIELTPFLHQVGGHSFMLSLDEATVCKVLVPREFQFYKTLPDSVKKFAPIFYGTIQVKTVEGSDGYVKFFALPSTDYKPKTKRHSRVRFKRSGSIELDGETKAFMEEESSLEGSGLNPWGMRCHKDHMALPLDPLVKDFIILENLTWTFTHPCVLDLKMGTRQYGDAASLAKKQSKMVKVVTTTTAKLGLRVGGMQVYQAQSKRFLCRNKFYGRSLSVPGFQQALFQFLHNGLRFRSDVLPILISKLEELANVVGKMEAIRFYTTSLLLIYEGDDFEIGAAEPCLSDVHDSLIQGNLEKESRKTLSAESLTTYKDDSSVNEVSNRRRRTSSANTLEFSTLSRTSSNSSCNSTIFEDVYPTKEEPKNDCRSNRGSFRGRSFSTKSDPGGSFPPEPKVDVRIIDFAHSTHKAFDDAVVYSGPDRGFLFGLETLIALLKEIQTDYG